MLRTEIHSRLDHGKTPPRFARRAEIRIRSGLRRCAERLTRARVFLSEERAGGGGARTRCRLVLETRRGEPIVATGRGSDALIALMGAVRRARRQLRRREQRRGARLRRSSARRPVWRAA
jgi:ribosome-associated translation inhibitor RaiA